MDKLRRKTNQWDENSPGEFFGSPHIGQSVTNGPYLGGFYLVVVVWIVSSASSHLLSEKSTQQKKARVSKTFCQAIRFYSL